MICDVIFNYGRFLIIISTQEVSQLMKLWSWEHFALSPTLSFSFVPKISENRHKWQKQGFQNCWNIIFTIRSYMTEKNQNHVQRSESGSELLAHRTIYRKTETDSQLQNKAEQREVKNTHNCCVHTSSWKHENIYKYIYVSLYL